MQAIGRLRHMHQALLGCLALVVGMIGCTTLPQLPGPTERPPVSGAGQEASQIPTRAYMLGPGDALRVNVYDNPDLSQEVTIGPDGSFSYPLVGGVHAAGFAVPE